MCSVIKDENVERRIKNTGSKVTNQNSRISQLIFKFIKISLLDMSTDIMPSSFFILPNLVKKLSLKTLLIKREEKVG